MPKNATAYLAFYAKIEASSAEVLTEILTSKLPEETKTVYLLLCTPGGSVSHGIALYNLLRALPYDIVTHNIANADSIGNVLFMAGGKRYASAASTFLVHKISSEPGQDKIDRSFLQEKLSCFEADERRVRDIICANTQVTEECLREHYTVGTCITAQKAVENGFAHAVREVKIPRAAFFAVVKASQPEGAPPKK